MKLVIDSNVLITYFWPTSVFNRVLLKHPILYTPEIALSEIMRYREDISRKAKLSTVAFDLKLEQLTKLLIIFKVEEYKSVFSLFDFSSFPTNEREELLDDIDFLALSLFLNCPLWSNDALLKKQSQVTVLNTKEMILLL